MCTLRHAHLDRFALVDPPMCALREVTPSFKTKLIKNQSKKKKMFRNKSSERVTNRNTVQLEDILTVNNNDTIDVNNQSYSPPGSPPGSPPDSQSFSQENRTNQINQINPLNQTNQINPPNQTNPSNQINQIEDGSSDDYTYSFDFSQREDSQYDVPSGNENLINGLQEGRRRDESILRKYNADFDDAMNIQLESTISNKPRRKGNLIIFPIADNVIAERLNAVSKNIDQVTLAKDTKESFYRFMTYVEKCYNNLINDSSVLISDEPFQCDKELPDELSNIMKNIENLQGPLPSDSNASWKAKDMVSLSDIIPVGDVSSTYQSKLFYCIFEDKVSGYFQKMDFVSYSNSRTVFTEGGSTTYTIRKYTDRPYLRTYFKKNYHRFGSRGIDFALFVLENISIILVHRKYVRILKNAVVFDFLSFLNNVIYWYQKNGNAIDMETLRVDKQFYINKRNPHLGIRTQAGDVADSNTIAQLFWLYELRYVNLDSWKFRTWEKVIPIVTNATSNKDELCSYHVQRDYDHKNIFNIDSKFDFLELPEGLGIAEPKEVEFSEDLKCYYDSLSEQEQNRLNEYISAFCAADNQKHFDLYLIYPYICYCMTNDRKYLDEFNKIYKTNYSRYDISSIISNLPSVPSPVEKQNLNHIGAPKKIIRDNSSMIDPKAIESRQQKLKEKRLKEKGSNNTPPRKITRDNSSLINPKAIEERQQRLKEKRLKDPTRSERDRREEIGREIRAEIKFLDSVLPSTMGFLRINNYKGVDEDRKEFEILIAEYNEKREKALHARTPSIELLEELKAIHSRMYRIEGKSHSKFWNSKEIPK